MSKKQEKEQVFAEPLPRGRWKVGASITVFMQRDPVSKGSMSAFVIRKGKHAGRAVVTDSHSTALKPYEAELRNLVYTECKRRALPCGVDQAFEVVQVFFLSRPTSHYCTDKIRVRDSAPLYPLSRPDLDKLARAAMDALSRVIVGDDGCVSRIIAEKRYADAKHPPGVHLTVRARPSTPREYWEQQKLNLKG